MPGREAVIQRLVALLIITGIIAALVIYYVRQRAPKPLVLSGTIEAHSVSVGSLVGGRVDRVLIVEGSPVIPGQPLATLESDITDRQLAEQDASIAAAKANLEKAVNGSRREDIEKARVVAAAAERERRRYERLWSEGVVSREAYDQMIVNARTTATELEKLEHGSRREEIDAARAQYDREIKRLATLQEQRNESAIRSDVAGVVQSIGIRPGDLVAPNQGVIEIIETGQLWVTVYVPETMLGLVTMGHQATVRIDTFPDRTYRGRVVQIATEGEYTPRNVQTRTQRADQVFGVKVMLEPNRDLKPGMAADVDFGVKGRR